MLVAALDGFAFDELRWPGAHGAGIVARVALQHGERADVFLQRLAPQHGQDVEGVASLAVPQRQIHDSCGRRQQVGAADYLV